MSVAASRDDACAHAPTQPHHTMLQVPMVSVRDALYDLMWDDSQLTSALGISRRDILTDEIHPTTRGHTLYGSLVAFGLRNMLAIELAALADSARGGGMQTFDTPAAAALSVLAAAAGDGAQLPLPQPVSPLAARQADADTFCAGESTALCIGRCCEIGNVVCEIPAHASLHCGPCICIATLNH